MKFLFDKNLNPRRRIYRGINEMQGIDAIIDIAARKHPIFEEIVQILTR